MTTAEHIKNAIKGKGSSKRLSQSHLYDLIYERAVKKCLAHMNNNWTYAEISFQTAVSCRQIRQAIFLVIFRQLIMLYS